jgi:hypothetical protein
VRCMSLRGVPNVLPEFKIVSRGRPSGGARRHMAPLSRFVLASRTGITGDFHNKIGPKRRFAASQPNVRSWDVGSTGRCNTGVKSLRWGFECQSLTWPFVELTSHFVQMSLRMHRQSVPFGRCCLSRRLVFSLEPRCHGLCGSLCLLD